MKFTREHLKNLVIVLVCVTIISYVLAGISALIGGVTASKEGPRSLSSQKSFPVEGVEKITISTMSGEIIVEESDDDRLKVILDGKAYRNSSIKLDAVQRGNTIQVEIKRRKIGFFPFSLSPHNVVLKVYLPPDYSHNLILSSVSGKIRVKELNARELTVKTTSGKIEVKQFTAEKVKLSSTSGDIDVEEMYAREIIAKGTSANVKLKRVTGEVTATTVSGDLKIEYEEFGSPLTARTTSGDVRLNLDEGAQFSVDFSTVSGDFSTDFPLLFKEKGNRSVTGFVKEGAVLITVKTVSGDCKISD